MTILGEEIPETGATSVEKNRNASQIKSLT